MKILIATGGTGGHLYPAILIGRELQRYGNDVLFTIGKREIEVKIINSVNASYEMLPLLPPSNHLHYPSILFSLIKAFSIIKDFKPDKVIGTGSYTSFPILFWAKIFKIPVYLHEQNTIPGKVTKLFSKYAKKVFISFPETKNYLKGANTIFTGLPVREIDMKSDCSKLLKEMGIKKEGLIFLAFGGSQGSVKLLKMLKVIEKEIEKLKLEGIIIKGDIKLKFNYSFPHVLKDYVHDMPSLYKISDFVISRGGASTIWELINAKKPAVIIPIENNLHQFKNALFFKKIGGGYVIEEENKEMLLKSIQSLIRNRDSLRRNLESFEVLNWKEIIREELISA